MYLQLYYLSIIFSFSYYQLFVFTTANLRSLFELTKKIVFHGGFLRYSSAISLVFLWLFFGLNQRTTKEQPINNL